MALRKSRILVPLIALCALLVGAGVAEAQVTYQITSTPTFVINTGRSEVVGAVRVTALNAGPTIASTLEFLFENMGCDNNTTTGIALNFGPAPATNSFTAANTTHTATSNTSGGCVVAVTVAGGIVTAGDSTDFIEVIGVRGRIDLSPAATPGVDISVRLNATPSGSSLFTTPSTARVATSADGLIVSISAGQLLVCTGAPTSARVRLTEGFNGAFVQHVVSLAGTPIPVGARIPPAGATNNTWFNIVIADTPGGVVFNWPLVVTGTNLSGAGAGGASAGNLQLRFTSATQVIYEFVTTDQGISDVNTERFDINLTAPAGFTITTPVSLGTATAQAQLYPPTFTGDATSVTGVPFGTVPPSGVTFPSAMRPRFNDPLEPATPAALLRVNPCATNLLYPYVVARVAGFDTGLVIANTSRDPFGVPPSTVTASTTARGATPQAGTCTLTGWPAATGTPAVSFTTPSVAAGASYINVLTGIPVFDGFQGYIIARCNFQFAHGFAFIVDGLGLSAPRIAEGYVANVIPDPFALATVLATYTRSAITAGNAIFGAPSGEGEGLAH